MRKLKWGIISTGNIAVEQVIPAIQKSVNGEVLAISSGSGKEQKVAKDFSIPKTYNSHEALLKDKEIDAVYIPLPNSMHAEWCIKAAKAKKHLLCEKPIALNQVQFKGIQVACEMNNVYFMEAFMYRFHPQHQVVKELISNNEIGRLLSIQSKFHFTVEEPEKDIRMKKELGGGVTYDIGCYSTNLINYLLDQKPVKVFASAYYEQVDTKLTAILEYENGVTGVIDSSFYGPMINKYEVIGTEGVIEVPHAFRPDLNDDVGTIILKNKSGEKTFNYKEAQYVKEVEHFSLTISDKSELSYKPLSAYNNIVTMDAILESAKERKVITI